MSIKRIIILVIGLCVGFFAYSLFDKISEDSSTQNAGPPPVYVQVQAAEQQQWYDVIPASGTISAFKGIMIKPEVSGKITQIYFKSGSFVNKGDALIQIYPDILESQLQRDKAARALAKVEYERAKELYTKRAVSKQDLDQASSNLAQAQASVGGTEAKLRQHNIVAPFEGQVGLRLVDLGDHVSPGQDIVNLQQIHPIRIEFSIPEGAMSKLAKGQTVEVSPSSAPNAIHKGKVYAFDSAVNQQTRSLFMRARIPNKDHKLLPGTFAKVSLLAGEKRSVVIVQQESIVYNPAGLIVYVIEDNKAVQTPVTLGQRNGNDVEITSGVNVGDQVVIAGQIKLNNNAAVKIVPNDSSDDDVDTSNTDSADNSSSLSAISDDSDSDDDENHSDDPDDSGNDNDDCNSSDCGDTD